MRRVEELFPSPSRHFEELNLTQHALLNNKDHRDLRVITMRGAAYGDDAMFTATFPAEFRNIQAYFPIVFAKSRDGTFAPLALFGFRDKQNLFLQGDRWASSRCAPPANSTKKSRNSWIKS